MQKRLLKVSARPRLVALLSNVAMCLALLGASPSCQPIDDHRDERTGATQLAVSDLPPAVNITSQPTALTPVIDASTTAVPTDIPYSPFLLTGFRSAEPTGSMFPAAAFAFGPQGWHNQTSPDPDQYARRWNDASGGTPHAPWTTNPLGQFEIYGVPLLRYEAAPVALSSGYAYIGALITTTVTVNGTFPAYDVVLMSSDDGGRSFDEGRVLSTGDSGGGSSPILPETVHASTVVTREAGTIYNGLYTAEMYVVWRGGFPTSEWWVTKVLVAPLDGTISVLMAPKIIDWIPNTAGTVTVTAWEQWEDGEETVAFLWSERRQGGNPITYLPSCPTNAHVEIQWRYSRAYYFDSPDPDWVWSGELIYEDQDWRPCVGPSYSSTSPHYVNSDRADMAVNNGWPFLHNITFTASDPDTKEMRVWLRKNGDPENYWEPELSMMPGDATTEHYNPKLAAHQGDGLQGPLFALVRKAVHEDGSVRVVGRTYHWWFDPQLGPGPPDDPEQFVTGYLAADEADLSPAWTPTAPHGTTLGLTVAQRCIKEEYGACDEGSFDPYPEVDFYATWPQTQSSVSEAIFGRKFEH